jgi:hypothetical protein
MLSQLEWALPRLDKTVSASVAHRVHTFLLAGQSANIECTSVQLGLIARDLCQNVTEHDINHSLTITEGDTVVILQTPITTKTTEQ